jgi:hypothetical protein
MKKYRLRLQWRTYHDITLGFLSPSSSMAEYCVAKCGEFWYWSNGKRDLHSRPYIDRKDAMRGAQRHHEERGL